VAHATTTVDAPTARVRPLRAAPSPGLDERRFRLAVAASTTLVGAFLAFRATAWPPHEDEALELYVGHRSLPALLDTVLGERGGAPLHFLLAWAVVHLGGGLEALRFVSAAFALASVPLIAALAVRLADRTIAAVATALAAVSWMLLFHGVYGRMYSLFLFTSALSYLALLEALRVGGRRRWALWVVAVLATVATHPYGALVLGSQVVFVVVRRERLREAALAGTAVAVLGTPFWITDLVLAGRFDVGVGGGGAKLGGPIAVLEYFGEVIADFAAGPVLVPVVLVLVALGARNLVRTNSRAATLVACAVGTPAAAFVLARLGSAAAPETRHLVFTLPFFATLLAGGVVAVARSGRPGAEPGAVAVAALLAVGAVAWGWDKTPALFRGEPQTQVTARERAAGWLAATGRPNDVLLGYEPVFLGAWKRSPRFSRLVLPRADARLALSALRDARRPLGRGIWVLNSADTTNIVQESTIPPRRPRPGAAFDVRAFGPLLVVRTRRPVGTPARYLRTAAAVMILGKTLGIGDADINFVTVARATRLLYGGSPS